VVATDKPVLAAPAMNVRMWLHPATQANVATLADRGVTLIGPNEGDMACGEYGPGRMAEPAEILAAVESYCAAHAPLAGRRALITSGPTYEAIDPVRYIANHSSGKQGHAIAAACARLGADVTLVSGPSAIADPLGVTVVHIESAAEMLEACMAALPQDVAICAAAVSDWRAAAPADQKIKKNGAPPALELTENPDILATLAAAGNQRPALVVGFAAETEKLAIHARAKLERKGCDWIVANDVTPDANGNSVMGGDHNTVHLVTGDGDDIWPTMTKEAVAKRLAARIAEFFAADHAA
jgi:phosphopantothenoylcysteine decarboxylase/phosphopantothenate--cysteine ligase